MRLPKHIPANSVAPPVIRTAPAARAYRAIGVRFDCRGPSLWVVGLAYFLTIVRERFVILSGGGDAVANGLKTARRPTTHSEDLDPAAERAGN
jgi:hypothetical protein